MHSHMRAKKKMCLWFGGTDPLGLQCGNKHIIMAIHVPTPQSVTVGTKRHH